MLLRLLRMLNQGGTRSLEDLARELDVSAPLLEAMVEDLARSGYLRRLDATCSASCKACAERASCTTGSRLWTLTERGAELARRGL